MPFQDGIGIGFALGDDAAFGRNNGRCTGIGGTDHIASKLHRAGLGLLELLVHGVGIAIPRHIADVGKQRSVFGGSNEFVAKAVFIADVEGDFLTFHG